MILVIRGHIRNAFDTQDLFHFIQKVYNLVPDLQIFIHTWNIFANNVSWRRINENLDTVTEETIYTYFGSLKHLIKHIIIDDDSKIKLIGNLEGTINNGITPLIGWKNYWYGKHRIIDYLYHHYPHDKDQIVVNIRFDILNIPNTNRVDETLLLDFIKIHTIIFLTKNEFLFDDESHYGIDNVYIGSIHTMYKLTNTFLNELDNILIQNNDIKNQEMLVFRINQQLFA